MGRGVAGGRAAKTPEPNLQLLQGSGLSHLREDPLQLSCHDVPLVSSSLPGTWQAGSKDLDHSADSSTQKQHSLLNGGELDTKKGGKKTFGGELAFTLFHLF